MGKGSKPRPFAVTQDEYGAEWGRIFGEANQLGRRLTAKADGSNPSNVGSNPTAPARYVDDATGKEVTEDWWPDPMTASHAAVEGSDHG